MSGTQTPRTPASFLYKHKHTVSAQPTTSKSSIQIQVNNNRRNDYTVNIENEEFPNGYTFMETISTPGKSTPWKNKEQNDAESEPTKSSDRPIYEPQPLADIPDFNNYNIRRFNINTDDDDNTGMSVLALFDEYRRQHDADCNFNYVLSEEFTRFAIFAEDIRMEWLKSVEDNRRLQDDLDKANHEIGDYSNKLGHARRLLDNERKQRKKTEDQLKFLEDQMHQARDLLFNDKFQSRIPDDTREKLAFLNNTTVRSRASLDKNAGGKGRLNTISEVNSGELNSTGSLLSDFSLSRSEDDLDISRKLMERKAWKKSRCAQINEEEYLSPKKRRSSINGHVVEINPTDKIVATTTVTFSKDGPVHATSLIEAVPESDAESEPQIKSNNPPTTPVNDLIEKLWFQDQETGNKRQSSIQRQHTFIQKAVIRPDVCVPCNKRIKFGKVVAKCKDCRGLCHTECKNLLPLPCIPLVNTPSGGKGTNGIIADFVPNMSPMVPALIVHCLNEIELRGMGEIGIYRVPGSEKDVRSLKEKFLKSKSVPLLNNTEVHVICGVVKDFLRSLREPLITHRLWNDFVQAAEAKDKRDIKSGLYQAISQLPQPNRDTLAYVILHLHKVANSPDCKMPVSNLSKIFGPTIIGYSSNNPEPQTMFMETFKSVAVMEELMDLPLDFWASYVDKNSQITTPRNNKLLSQTPSTCSLPATTKGFFTPYGSKTAFVARKKRKFWGTPPNK